MSQSTARKMKRKTQQMAAKSKLVIDEQLQAALDAREKHVISKATRKLMCAFCFTTMFKFNDLRKRETRLNATLGHVVDYLEKINKGDLTQEEVIIASQIRQALASWERNSIQAIEEEEKDGSETSEAGD